MLYYYRSRAFALLSRRYIFAGRVPLVHALILLLELIMTTILAQKFNACYAARPVPTTMVTNAILGGIADTVAQTITITRARMNGAQNSPAESRAEAGIELQNMEKKGLSSGEAAAAIAAASRERSTLPPSVSFDTDRLARFMAYGFLIAPVQHRWFSFLSRVFPVKGPDAFAGAMKRVVADQMVFAPAGLAMFYTFMTIAEGKGVNAVAPKLREQYFPSLKANYILWPAVQLANFKFVPLPLQLPLVSTVGIAWTAYLSLTNASGSNSKQH